MKYLIILTIIAVSILLGCKSATESSDIPKATFDLYETVAQNELSDTAARFIQQLNIEPESNQALSIIGYVPVSLPDSFSIQSPDPAYKFLLTHKPFDQEGSYLAVVAVRAAASISNDDIKKTKPNGTVVEVYFNSEGARKWSDMTKSCLDEYVAFAVDDIIYTLPMINAPINNGIAVINGLESEEMAKEISTALNGSADN